MDSNILKTAISSVVFVAETDIQKINAFDPKSEEARRPEYLFSLANIARNVSKAFMCVDHLITSYVADAVGIDKDTFNKVIAATAEIVENMSQLIRDNPEAFLDNIGFIDKNGDQIGDRKILSEGEKTVITNIADRDDADSGKTASEIAAEISEKHRKEGNVCSAE